jgi:hypothetical protein
MRNFNEYKHEWKFDLPWHMVSLKDWFYMVNVGHFGDVFLHVRIFGIRSLWTFPEPEAAEHKMHPTAFGVDWARLGAKDITVKTIITRKNGGG